MSEIKEMQKAGKLHHNKDAKSEDKLDAKFWAEAEIKTPSKTSVHLKVDDDVFEFFKQDGKGHITRMQTVLRQYMEAHLK